MKKCNKNFALGIGSALVIGAIAATIFVAKQFHDKMVVVAANIAESDCLCGDECPCQNGDSDACNECLNSHANF